jgi:hypothetical protein
VTSRGGSRISGTGVAISEKEHTRRGRTLASECRRREAPRKIWKLKCYAFSWHLRISWFHAFSRKAGFFCGENIWSCAMNECLFWGKFWFENCTLLQKSPCCKTK